MTEHSVVEYTYHHYDAPTYVTFEYLYDTDWGY